MTVDRYAAVILAAGLSSRMEEFKPLLSIGGETITDRVISMFLQNDVEVVLVTGWRRDELIAGIEHRDITVVENHNYKSGMFSSVRAGVSHLPPHHRAFFVMPVDIPLVRPTTIKLLQEYAAEHAGKIIHPVFLGNRGHPPLIPPSLVPEIINWQGDGGLKAILDSHSEMNVEVKVPDENILLDVDNREDYTTLLERFRRYDIPTEQECMAIMDIAGTPDKIRRHCQKVTGVAVAIAEALSAVGMEVGVEAIRTASILHDIAKGQPEHDIAGGRMLSGMGFVRIGDIVAMHTDLAGSETTASIEAKIVYLADKFVGDEELVSIEERYNSAAEKYGAKPEIADKIERYKQQALSVKEEVKALLGYSPDRIIFS
ncbi:DVU_1551 family NTP transferase [Chloroflexota bacterium]